LSTKSTTAKIEEYLIGYQDGFAPFIWPEDERIQDPVKLMETVAERLWTGAQNERERRTRLPVTGRFAIRERKETNA
jgi:hypothetical protein